MVLFFVAFWLFCFTLANAANFCVTDKSYCFTSTLLSDQKTMQFTVASKVAGWIGIGLGSSMYDADMMILYVKSGKPIVSDRYSKDEVEPSVDPQQDTVLTNFTAAPTANVFVFTRLLDTGDSNDKVITPGPMSILFAYTTSPVSGTKLAQHDAFGSSSIDFFADQSVLASADSNIDNVRTVHAILMFVAWGVFSFTGIFIARYLKARLGIWWFRSHVATMMVTFLLTIIAFGLIVSITGKHFKSLHQILGLIVLILLFFQSVLGQVINLMWRPGRDTVPIRDMLHWYLGRFLQLLAIVTMFTGLVLKQVSLVYYILYGVSIGAVLIGFGVAEYLIGPKQHVNDARSPESKFKDASEFEISDPIDTHQLYNHIQRLK